MSINLVTIPQQQYSPPRGANNGQQVKTCTPGSGIPAVVPITLFWADYNPSWQNNRIGLQVSLQAQNAPGGAIDAIRSVKIDNSYCAVPIYVQFPDTLDTIVCPAYSIVIAPAYTNGLDAVVYGTEFYSGRSPQTTIEFANFDRQGLVLTDVAPNSVRVLPIGTAAQVAPFPYAQLFSLANAPIAADRIIVAAVTNTSNTSSQAASSPDFNGVPMTALPSANGGAGVAIYAYTRMFYVPFPSGQGSYSLSYNCGPGVQSSVASVFALYGASSLAQASVETAVNNASLAIPVSQPVPGGIVLSVSGSKSSPGPVWRNAEVLTYYDNIAGANIFHSTSYRVIGDTDPFSIGVNSAVAMSLAMFI